MAIVAFENTFIPSKIPKFVPPEVVGNSSFCDTHKQIKQWIIKQYMNQMLQVVHNHVFKKVHTTKHAYFLHWPKYHNQPTYKSYHCHSYTPDHDVAFYKLSAR